MNKGQEQEAYFRPENEIEREVEKLTCGCGVLEEEEDAGGRGCGKGEKLTKQGKMSRYGLPSWMPCAA